MTRKMFPLMAVCALLISPSLAGAALVHWADWTAATVGNPGSAAATIALSGGETIGVSYTGQVTSAQTSGGTFYWTYPSTYTSAFVDNAPASSDIIRVVGGTTAVSTLTFSRPVTDPVMAILSMGQHAAYVHYNFDAPFDVISEGRGYWGDGTLVELSGNVLRGAEGHGTIMFQGTFSSISWTMPNHENWHGFTVAVIPEPATLAFCAVGVVFLVYRRR